IAIRFSMTTLTMRSALRSESTDGIPQNADPFDFELDDVARLQPAPITELEDATRPHRARAEHVAGQKPRVACGVRDDRLPRVVHVGELAAGPFFAVHARDHRGAAAVELVRRDEDRTKARREILSLRRPEPDAHLRALQVARRPVVHDREPSDLPVGADHSGDLELIVELPRLRRADDLVAWAVDRSRVREVEDRDLVPLLRHLEPARRTRRLDVLLEGVEIAHRRRLQHRRTEVDVGEGVLGVMACGPPAGEERLQRLRRELYDLVALDQSRPAALELQFPRREHAESHGSVCTTTSAISGLACRIRSSISLARAWASASRLPPSRPSVRYTTTPSSVCRKRRSRTS